ncbi:RIO1 family-domain-containing protein [Dunaliella salina]|uniref:non-specific serine/threonine protein kinase n=1 Tax=Dunaliella salina TaxID=3046 RepID=A0ABQ7H6V2_DUNSA|nr:RIO1 family-domain-containing protein [Dunaliella salina]|eukprot:KAF5842584.1 RIO1 family-domain-containing protein [Dunaliella salina]
MELISRLASKGLIHCDFNEFNLLITEDEEITLIDFPQMVSVSHANAQDMFDRDVECIIKFFSKKIGYSPEMDPALPYVRPSLQDAVAHLDEKLDVGLAASGFKKKHQEHLEAFLSQPREDREGSSSEGEGDDDDDDEEEEGEGEEDVEGEEGGEHSGPCAQQEGENGVCQSQGQQNAGSCQDAAADTQGDSSCADGAQRREGVESAEGFRGEGNSSSSSSSEDTESSGSESEGERDLKGRLHQRRDVLQRKKLEALTHKTAHATLKERDVQHMVASQRKRDMKKEDNVRAGRNATKQAKGKGTRKTKGGGARGGADFAGW